MQCISMTLMTLSPVHLFLFFQFSLTKAYILGRNVGNFNKSLYKENIYNNLGLK